MTLLDIVAAREATVGTMPVRRALPRRLHRTVGAWCFADHMGPVAITAQHGVDIAPHPHIGLHTVTWLLQGELLHRDSLGSEQVIRPGQLNLMTAGHGVAHSEERTGRYAGSLEGIQLWVAQPEHTRHGPPAFEHHAQLPDVSLAGGHARVLIGELLGSSSPARHDTELVGLDLDLHQATTLEVRPDFEYALVVLRGALDLGGQLLTPGHLGYLGTGMQELALGVPVATRAMLLGGVPLGEPLMMAWNFVARTADETGAARDDWNDPATRLKRFGRVDSPLPPIPAP